MQVQGQNVKGTEQRKRKGKGMRIKEEGSEGTCQETVREDMQRK